MRFIDYDGLRAKGINYSKPHLWRLVRDGLFPQPVKLTPGRNTWVEAEVDTWIEERMAARESQSAKATAA